MLDIERLLSRVTLETANPRDVLALLRQPEPPASHQGRGSGLAAEQLADLNALLDELADLRERIEKTIVAEPPLTLADGGVIPAGC